jgi:hypothetical protein
VDYITACECQAWSLKVWPKDHPEQATQVPFKCRSWRHGGDCRLWKGAQDFARIKEAMEKHSHWSHLCLTFQNQSKSTPFELFKVAIYCWSRLRKRIIREYGDIQYIQTWERHKSGFPHVHIALSNIEMYEREFSGGKETFDELIRNHAVESGFGKRGWLEPLRDQSAFAGYLTKLARELTGRGKDYQIPTNAPKHFRRLRASVGLLPPKHKNPDITGMLQFCSHTAMDIKNRSGDPEMSFEMKEGGMDAALCPQSLGTRSGDI